MEIDRSNLYEFVIDDYVKVEYNYSNETWLLIKDSDEEAIEVVILEDLKHNIKFQGKFKLNDEFTLTEEIFNNWKNLLSSGD